MEIEITNIWGQTIMTDENGNVVERTLYCDTNLGEDYDVSIGPDGSITNMEPSTLFRYEDL